jgi:hypothetical protein
MASEVMDACTTGHKYWGIRDEPGHFLDPERVRFCPRAGVYFSEPLTDPFGGEVPFCIGGEERAYYFDAARLPGTPLIILDVRWVVDGELGEQHYGAYPPEEAKREADRILEDCLDAVWTIGTRTPACHEAVRAFQFKVRALADAV